MTLVCRSTLYPIFECSASHSTRKYTLTFLIALFIYFLSPSSYSQLSYIICTYRYFRKPIPVVFDNILNGDDVVNTYVSIYVPNLSVSSSGRHILWMPSIDSIRLCIRFISLRNGNLMCLISPIIFLLLYWKNHNFDTYHSFMTLKSISLFSS